MLSRGGNRKDRYLADHMLGRLGKWMRIMGIDTEYAPGHFSDSMLKKYCDDNDRKLVTRDVELAFSYKNSILLKHTEIEHQIREISSFLTLNKEDFFKRCTICNTSLILSSAMNNSEIIPDGAKEKTILQCPTCGRFYWEGTHTKNMIEILKICGVYK
ncbi:MAG: Mut7-C RNAse domain-containing protein [Thermoplasmataceae archaeon]